MNSPPPQRPDQASVQDLGTRLPASTANLPRRPSQTSAASSGMPSSQVESWRSKSHPPPPQREPLAQPQIPAFTPPPTFLEQPDALESLVVLPDEELEVIDFL